MPSSGGSDSAARRCPSFTDRPLERPLERPVDRPIDSGQAVVELALCMPLVCLFLLTIVQVGLVVSDQLLVEHAAREAARAASVSASPAAGGAAAAARVAPESHVSVAADSHTVTATVTLRSHTDVPLIGALVADVQLRASATMVREPP
jgi:Flp pilus assembly protein TadG